LSELIKSARELVSFRKFGSKLLEERRASVFGMQQSGKTTTLGLLEIVCINYAGETNKPGSKTKFYSLIVERSSGIRQIAGELRQGMFPERTPADRTFEADYLMRFGSRIGEKQIRLPFCETGGEAFTAMLERWGKGQYAVDPNMQDADLIFDYVLNTDAIILILPITRPLGLEMEVGAPLNLPDVNAARLVSGIFGYKMEDEKTNQLYRPIRGVAVFLTKLDAAEKTLAASHINIKTKEGLHVFMSRYFPETYATLSWYGLENVRFWTTGLTIETEKDPITGRRKGKLHPLNPTRGYQIKVNYNRNMPVGDYETQMHEFIEWLKNTVMA
jgi:hypothetical protein